MSQDNLLRSLQVNLSYKLAFGKPWACAYDFWLRHTQHKEGCGVAARKPPSAMMFLTLLEPACCSRLTESTVLER